MDRDKLYSLTIVVIVIVFSIGIVVGIIDIVKTLLPLVEDSPIFDFTFFFVMLILVAGVFYYILLRVLKYSDILTGLIFIGFSIGGIVAEIYYIVYLPYRSTDPNLAFTRTPVYWAQAIPFLIITLVLLLLILWIGISMVSTPPPEEWSFDAFDTSEDKETGDIGESKKEEVAGDIEAVTRE